MAHSIPLISRIVSAPHAASKISLLVLLAWGVVPEVQAQTALRDVVVSGSRSEQDPAELPMTIDVLRAQDIEQRSITDMRDVARDIPNVEVQRSPARFRIGDQTGRDQNAGFAIRGLDGNRVLMLVDGIRQPRGYVFPSESAIGRDYLDVGLVKRVEVVKGSVSALYGSDGVAGLVNFITKDPIDFLQGGKTFGGSASIGYEGDENGKRIGATLAGKASDSWSWLLSASANEGRALKNMGTNDAPNQARTTPNPETNKGNSLLGKLVFSPSAGQRHVFTVEHVDKNSDYNLLSNIGLSSILAANGWTDMTRNRVSYDGFWRVNTLLADELRATLSYQDADSTEYYFQRRSIAPADRVRNTYYGERTAQANLQAGKTLRDGPDAAQKITYGFDYTNSELRNLQTGVAPAAGETYPLKRFPDTREQSAALYLQDEIVRGAWSVTPGVRFDHFSIDANQAGYVGTAQSLSGSATSPKLGVLFRASPVVSVYGNYSAGFKAPTAGQVNGYFTNPIQGYRTDANPDLKPEKSQNFEFGARTRTERVSFDAAVFTGRFRDFIEDFADTGRGTFGNPGNPRIFQTANIGRVRISGVELKGNVDWGKVGGGVLSTPFGYGYTKGTNLVTHQPLNSISPVKLTAGVKYDTAQFMVRFDVTHRQGKSASDIDPTALATQFAPPTATTFDLSGQWRIAKDLRLNAGIYNLTDRKYWNWLDVRGVASTSAVLDAYTQAGRYARLSLVKDF